MWYNVIMTVVAILLGFFSVYLKNRTDLYNKAEEYINKAEEEFSGFYKAGSRKFQFVVQSLYALVPKPLKIFITEDMIATIVQTVFDGMADFAAKQLDNLSKPKIDTE